MFRKGIFIAVILAGLLLVAVQVALAADADVVISEVMFNSHCHSMDPATCITTSTVETRFEWVEVYDKDDVSADLNGWMIQDNSLTRTITTAMCPGGSCVLGSHQCWVIGWNTTAISTEISNYSGVVDASRTISLGTAIGGGLSNSNDYVILKNATGGNVDCVSWNSTTGTVCSDLTYISGGSGVDTALDAGTEEAQSIANIQGTWYYHGPGAVGASDQGSPYNCVNTAAGGSPSAVRLLRLTVRERALSPLGAGLVLLGLVGLAVSAVRRR